MGCGRTRARARRRPSLKMSRPARHGLGECQRAVPCLRRLGSPPTVSFMVAVGGGGGGTLDKPNIGGRSGSYHRANVLVFYTVSATRQTDRLADGPQIHLRVHPSLLADLVKIAREQDKPVARVIRAALRQYVEDAR
jgi:hypothetical protein